MLGPLLFLAYINDMPKAFDLSETKLFADDSIVFRIIKIQADSTLLQKGLTALETWEGKWQMKLNPSKCTVVRISPNKTSPVDSVVTKSNRTLGLVRRNLKDCPKTIRKRSYLTLVRPTVEYAPSVWNPTSLSKIKALENVQRRAERYVTREYTTRHLDASPTC